MKVLRNAAMVETLNANIAKNEMSNVAMILQTPTILTTWWVINPNLTTLVPGTRNITEYVGEKSEVVYDRIEHTPMSGIDNLTEFSEFDEEEGHHEDFQSSGILYPNTFVPPEGSMFKIDSDTRGAIFIVTATKPCTTRSNPFTEVSFRLFTREPGFEQKLNKQVHDELEVAMSTIGYDKTLVIKKGSRDIVAAHVKNYLELSSMFAMLFYNKDLAAFTFGGYPDPRTGQRKATFVDMTLWRMMFDEGIIIFDDIVTYANDNLGQSVERIFTSCPDIYVSDYSYHNSILVKLFTADKGSKFDKNRYPVIWEPSPMITKYQGLDIWYLENYQEHPFDNEVFQNFYLWDDEFLCRIRNNDLYEEVDLNEGICLGCAHQCTGKPVTCYNPFLRNIIIRWFNQGDDEIDWEPIWENLQVTAERTIENYYLVPIVLGIYKRYIQELQ